jgi:hypothetical protein
VPLGMWAPAQGWDATTVRGHYPLQAGDVDFVAPLVDTGGALGVDYDATLHVTGGALGVVYPIGSADISYDATLTNNGGKLGINLANANTWTGQQTFNDAVYLPQVSSGGTQVLFIRNPNGSAAEALWYNGTYASWGYGLGYNFFGNGITIGNKAAPPTNGLYVAGVSLFGNFIQVESSKGGDAGFAVLWNPAQLPASATTEIGGIQWQYNPGNNVALAEVLYLTTNASSVVTGGTYGVWSYILGNFLYYIDPVSGIATFPNRLQTPGGVYLTSGPTLPTAASAMSIGGGYASPAAGKIAWGDGTGWQLQFVRASNGTVLGYIDDSGVLHNLAMTGGPYVYVQAGGGVGVNGAGTLYIAGSDLQMLGGGLHLGSSYSAAPAAGSLRADGNVSANTLTSTVATGTAPLVVSSSSQVAGLSASSFDLTFETEVANVLYQPVSVSTGASTFGPFALINHTTGYADYYFEASGAAGSATITVELWDFTSGAAVSGSTVSFTGNNVARSGTISLTAGHTYGIYAYISSATGAVWTARVVALI